MQVERQLAIGLRQFGRAGGHLALKRIVGILQGHFRPPLGADVLQGLDRADDTPRRIADRRGGKEQPAPFPTEMGKEIAGLVGTPGMMRERDKALPP